MKIDSANASCSAQESVLAQTLDGVLALIDPKYTDSSSSSSYDDPGNPLIVLLDGWGEGQVPPRQFRKEGLPLTFGGVVGKDELAQGASIIPKAPKEVNFEMNTYGNLRGNSYSIGASRAPCAISLERDGEGYNITASYSVRHSLSLLL